LRITGVYLPPPAQAQAHPAQAQAHAQERPPPPPPLLLLLEAVACGTGLVRLVTPEVKVLTSPRARLENPCTLFTTEAAKADPGTLTEDRPLDGTLEMVGAAVLPLLIVLVGR